MPDYTITETRNGFKTLTVLDKTSGKEIRLHSTYDPVKESDRSVDAFDKGKSSIIVVSGIALGYHLTSLRKKYPDVKIVAIEKDSEIIKLCSETYPDAVKGISLVTSVSDIINIFDSINLAEFKGISNYIHKPSYQLNPDFYDSTLNSIKLAVSSRISDLLTRFEFEEKWIENIFRNLKHLENVTGVAELFGKFKRIPGIIVSTGPSLKNSINDLRLIKEKAVIVAVDTSLKVLAKHNIEPHFVLTLDAQKYSVKHFTGVKTSETVLIADIVSCPSILNTFKGERILSTTSKYYQNSSGETIRETTPVIDWIEKTTPPFGDVQSGGSVATSAFDLLLNMGCDPIILVGQDLAYTGREYHCSGTYHNDDWIPKTNRFSNLDSINQNVIRKRKTKYVKNYGKHGMVISDFVFDLYRSWFEDSAGTVPVTVINSTGGGSWINNTREMNLSDAVEIFNNRKNPEPIIRSLLYRNTKKDISGIKKSITDGYHKLKKITELTGQEIPDDLQIERINELLEDDDIHSLLNPLLRKSQFYISRHAFSAEKTKEIMYNDIRVSAQKMMDFLKGSNLVE